MKDGCESSLEDYLKQKKKELGCNDEKYQKPYSQSSLMYLTQVLEIFSFEIHSILLRKITIFNL